MTEGEGTGKAKRNSPRGGIGWNEQQRKPTAEAEHCAGVCDGYLIALSTADTQKLLVIARPGKERARVSSDFPKYIFCERQ